MPTVEIECPSGLGVVIRNMKAKEMALLADDGEDEAEKKKASARRTQKRNPMLGILQGVTLEVLNPGPYAGYGAAVGTLPVKDGDGKWVAGPGVLPWQDLLMCDWFYMLVRMRAATWGDEYEFRLRCRDKTCARYKKPFTWEIPLSGLEIKPLPAASRKRVQDKNVFFEVDLLGKKAKFKLQQWRDTATERDLTDIPKREIFLAQCASRLTYVEGVDVTDFPKLMQWVGEADLPDVIAATRTYDEVDGGIETNTIAECPACGLEFDVAIPFAAQSFLLPDKKTPGSSPMGEQTA